VVQSEAFAYHPPLGEGVKQHVPYALANAIEAVFRLTQLYKMEPTETAVAKKYYRSNKNRDKNRYISRHDLLPFCFQLSLNHYTLANLTGVQFLYAFCDSWNYLEYITHNPVGGHFKYWCLIVTVNGDNDIRVLHAD
jgi:hypothetical protein